MNIATETEEAIQEAKQSAKETSRDVADATKEAWNSFSEYTVEKKEQAAALIDKQVDALGDEMDELKKSAAQASTTTREKTEEALNTLEEKRRDLALQAKKVRNATSETWDKVKNETQEKWNAFTEYLTETKNDLMSS